MKRLMEKQRKAGKANFEFIRSPSI